VISRVEVPLAKINGGWLIPVAPVRITQKFPNQAPAPLAIGFGFLGVGFDLWWALFAWIDMRRATKNSGIPFHLGWWGVVFPVVSMAIAIDPLDAILDSSVFISLADTTIGILVWLFIASETIIEVITHRTAKARSR